METLAVFAAAVSAVLFISLDERMLYGKLDSGCLCMRFSESMFRCFL